MRYLHFQNARGDLQEGHFTLPDANCLSFRAQNRHFCALLPSETPIFWLFEHKIGVFVSEWAIFPRFWAVLTQNRHFCALLGSGTPVFWPLEHKIGVFVRFCQQVSSRCRLAGEQLQDGNDATGGVGNSSAQTVGDHAPREWEDPQAKRCGGMERSGSLCGRACRSAEANALRLRRRRGCR